MPRFFIDECPDAALDSLTITGADFHHIRDVLRLKAGDAVTVCDCARNDLQCRIERFLQDGVVLAILDRQPNQTEPLYHVTLYQGLAKGDKMDTIIQKAVELGASRIVPVACRRCVTRLDRKDAGRKVQRWQRIASEAAKQCGRGQVPEVGELLSFDEAATEAAQADIALMPWEGERECSLRTGLESPGVTTANPSISILIGPEGGFDADEVTTAMAAGIRPVTLGRRILRTETAGAAVLAMIIYRFGDF